MTNKCVYSSTIYLYIYSYFFYFTGKWILEIIFGKEVSCIYCTCIFEIHYDAFSLYLKFSLLSQHAILTFYVNLYDVLYLNQLRLFTCPQNHNDNIYFIIHQHLHRKTAWLFKFHPLECGFNFSRHPQNSLRD